MMARSAEWRTDQFAKAAESLDRAEGLLSRSTPSTDTSVAKAEALIALAMARYRAIEVDNQERQQQSS